MNTLQDTLDGIRLRLRHASADDMLILIPLAIALHNELRAGRPHVLGGTYHG
jgi:hypothetical protein